MQVLCKREATEPRARKPVPARSVTATVPMMTFNIGSYSLGPESHGTECGDRTVTS